MNPANDRERPGCPPDAPEDRTAPIRSIRNLAAEAVDGNLGARDGARREPAVGGVPAPQRAPAHDVAALRTASQGNGQDTPMPTLTEPQNFDFAPDVRRGPLAVIERVAVLQFGDRREEGWLIRPSDHPGRTPFQAYHSLRAAARRSGLPVTVSRVRGGVAVRTELIKPISHVDFGVLMMCAKNGIHPRKYGYDVRGWPEPAQSGDAEAGTGDDAPADTTPHSRDGA